MLRTDNILRAQLRQISTWPESVAQLDVEQMAFKSEIGKLEDWEIE